MHFALNSWGQNRTVSQPNFPEIFLAPGEVSSLIHNDNFCKTGEAGFFSELKMKEMKKRTIEKAKEFQKRFCFFPFFPLFFLFVEIIYF